MNPYRILKTDNGYEIVRVSYDEDGRPKSMAGVDFISAEGLNDLKREISLMEDAVFRAKLGCKTLTYADFKREG